MARLVVKLGTSVLTAGTQRLNRAQMVDIARQCSTLQQDGHELIVCSSGAIAAGRERLDFPDLAAGVTSKQLLAAVGQSRLMLLWEQFFAIYGITVGQILLTRADVENRQRYLNARDAFQTCIAHGIVPVVNENDAVATEEIKVGDNDNLSALVATLADAELLLLLTDQPGLFSADPRTNPDAELIKEVHDIDASLKAIAGNSVSGLGVGGMATKLQSADIARRAGIDVVIAAGSTPNVIERVVNGEPLGTRFPAIQTPLERRKRWILAGPRAAGQIVVDSGAAGALQQGGRSLLPAGILRADGQFQRGDTILIMNEGGAEIARGIVRYSFEEVAQLIGKQSAEIESILGYSYGTVVVHRNDLIVL